MSRSNDGLDVLVDDDAGTQTKYLNGPGIDNKQRVQTGSGVSYFLADHLGSTNGLADQSAAVVNQTSYDSFGNAIGNLGTRYQFTGREFDSFSGLQYSRARWYDRNLGRFISVDPIGFGGGDINLFAYVRNQPLWFRDPMGLQPGGDVLSQPSTWQVIGAAAAAASAWVPPVAVAATGAAAIYGAAKLGEYTASHPSNPFVNGPLNPFGNPYPGSRPFPPISVSPTSQPYCMPVPRAIPFYRTPTLPWPEPNPDREGCAEEISQCYQLCAKAQFDPDMRNIWGGSVSTCMRGCVSARCQKGLKF